MGYLNLRVSKQQVSELYINKSRSKQSPHTKSRLVVTGSEVDLEWKFKSPQSFTRRRCFCYTLLQSYTTYETSFYFVSLTLTNPYPYQE